MSEYKYKRVLLKLSGEALANSDGSGFNISFIESIAKQVKEATNNGVEVAIVCGGGNIIRGATQEWMNRENADYMGMLATVINSMTIFEVFDNCDIKAKVFSAVPMEVVCDTYSMQNVEESISDGCVVILGGGTGKPYVTTDTTATLRARELNCECVLKATKVDGVYDSDPVKNPKAMRFDEISYDESLERGLKIMDDTAFKMAKESKIPIVVFNGFRDGNILSAIMGEKIGTLVS